MHQRHRVQWFEQSWCKTDELALDRSRALTWVSNLIWMEMANWHKGVPCSSAFHQQKTIHIYLGYENGNNQNNPHGPRPTQGVSTGKFIKTRFVNMMWSDPFLREEMKQVFLIHIWSTVRLLAQVILKCIKTFVRQNVSYGHTCKDDSNFNTSRKEFKNFECFVFRPVQWMS